MANLVKVLIVEQSEAHTNLIVREMLRGGYTVECERVNTAMRMSNALVEKNWDIVISDY